MQIYQRLGLISALFGICAWLARGIIGLHDAIELNTAIASNIPIISWNLVGFNLTILIVLLFCIAMFAILYPINAVRDHKQLRTKLVLGVIIICPGLAYISYFSITSYYQNLASKNGYSICFRIKTQHAGPDTRQNFFVAKNIILQSGCPEGLTLGNGL